MRLVKWGNIAKRLHRGVFFYSEAVDFRETNARDILFLWHQFHRQRRIFRRGNYFDTLEIDGYLEPFGMQIEGVERTKPVEPLFRVYHIENDDATLKYSTWWIHDHINCTGLSKEEMDHLEAADVFRQLRCPWRKMTKPHLACIIANMGGELL